jgi:hypothetical protein
LFAQAELLQLHIVAPRNWGATFVQNLRQVAKLRVDADHDLGAVHGESADGGGDRKDAV